MKNLKPCENTTSNNNKRSVDVQIVDNHGDVETGQICKCKYVSFNFIDINDLDKKIDDYIINDTKIRKATVTIDDYSSILSKEEGEELKKKGYYLDICGFDEDEY